MPCRIPSRLRVRCLLIDLLQPDIAFSIAEKTVIRIVYWSSLVIALPLYR